MRLSWWQRLIKQFFLPNHIRYVVNINGFYTMVFYSFCFLIKKNRKKNQNNHNYFSKLFGWFFNITAMCFMVQKTGWLRMQKDCSVCSFVMPSSYLYSTNNIETIL